MSIFPSTSMSDETESFHHPIILYDWEELGEEGPLLGPPKEITKNVYNTIREQCTVMYSNN